MAAEGEEGDIDLLNDETFGDGAVGELSSTASPFALVSTSQCGV